MNKPTSYSEKLKDPRWQKKRLQILDRDSFTCQVCHSDKKTLHVHHKKYEKGKDPWEYDNEYLITLCEGCHKYETDHFDEAFKELSEILRTTLTTSGIESLMSAFGNTVFRYSPDLYAEIADDVFHSKYLEEIVHKKNNGWSQFSEDE